MAAGEVGNKGCGIGAADQGVDRLMHSLRGNGMIIVQCQNEMIG